MSPEPRLLFADPSARRPLSSDGMIRDDEPGPLSVAARRVIPALVFVWIAAAVVSLARRDGQPVGDCTFGAGVGLVGLVMLVKDQWPGKRMIDFGGGGDRQPLSGWYGRS